MLPLCIAAKAEDGSYLQSSNTGSICARASIGERLAFYKEKGYDGVFVTNHFLDGNINLPQELPYEAGLDFYFSDYEA